MLRDSVFDKTEVDEQKIDVFDLKVGLKDQFNHAQFI